MKYADGPQVYLLSSSLVWVVISIALADTKYPVWYPYYLSWTITILVEVILVFLGNPGQRSRSITVLTVLSLQLVRLLLLATMFVVFILPRNSQEVCHDDEERQALLRKKSDAKRSDSTEDDANVDAAYGSMDATADCEESDVSSEAESEDSWIRGRSKASKRAAERLKSDGNWWTYAKGFSVSLPQAFKRPASDLQIDG